MKLRSNPFAAVSIALLSATSTLHAASFYWDGTDTSANADGGVGTWDTVATNWDDAATAGASLAWPSTSSGDDDAFFGTPSGAVTISAPGITANSLTFSVASYVVGGSPLTLDSIDPDGAGPLLAPAPIISAGPGSNTQSATINANIVSANGLSKTGGSTLTLGGDLSGVVGTLTIDGAITSPINNAAGIQLQSGVSTSGLTGIDIKNNSFLALAGVSLGASTPIILNGGGGNQAPQGAVRGAAGVNTVAGPVTINDAAVRIGNTGTSTTFSGAITTPVSTNGLFVRIGSNQGVILTNSSNSWEGPTSIAEGSLYIFPNALPSNSNLIVGSSAGADFGTNATFTRALGSGSGQIQFGRANDGQRASGFTARGGALTVNLGGAGGDVVFLNTFAKTGATNATSTVTVDITNLAVGMSVTGSGIPTDTLISAIGTTTITLNKAATTTVASNALTFYAAQDTARINSSVFVLNGANADSPISLANPLDLNGFTRTIQVNANTATLAGGIKNSSATAGGLRKTGTGTLVLSTANTYTGGTVVVGVSGQQNTLRVSHANALGTGSLTIGGAGNSEQARLELTGGITIANSIVALTSRSSSNNSPNIINVSGNNTINSNISAGGGGDRTTIESAADKLVLSGSVSVRRLNLFGEGEGEISGSVTNASGNSLNKAGGGKWTIGGNISNSTGVTIVAGTLQIGNGGATGSLGLAPTIANDGALIFDRTGEVAIPGLISGTGTLTKRGSSAITLTAANTYTGTTSVEAGSLLINGDHTAATGATSVSAAAGLGGDGTINAATYAGGAKFPWTVADWTAAPSLSAGAVSIDGALTVVVDDSLPGTPVSNFTDATTTFTILSASSLTVTNPSLLTVDSTAFTSGSGTWTVQKNGNTLELVYTVVVASPFTTWATTTNGLSGGDAEPTADPDNDGLDNSVEFVIGGQPNPANPNANSSALAPTISTDVGNLIFTFRRTDLSFSQPGILITAQYGSDLTGWTTAVNGENGVAIVVTNDIETGVDQVQVSIPKSLATGAKMFARLNVVIP